MVSGVSICIVVIVVGGILGSSSASSAASAVDCFVGCVSWGWEAMAGGLPIDVFAIFSEFAFIGIFMGIVGGSIWGSSLSLCVASVVNCDIGGARRVEVMSGRLKIVVLPVVSVCTIIGIVVFIVVIGCVVWNVFLSCRSCAKKLVRSASRSLLSGGGSLERSEGEGFALVAAGGRVVCIRLVVVIENSSSSSVVVVIVARKSSSTASAPSVVVCVGC